MRVMAEVCPTCGLPKDLCVCGEIEKEQQRIRIRLEFLVVEVAGAHG
jgi:translation initiation factor 1 (eIF-1/SUI1)